METAKKPLQIIDTSTEVSLQEKTYLVYGSEKFPIQAECASKYSLFFRYLNDRHIINTDGPVNLLLKNNGDRVELGPCRILPNPNLNGYAGRIVFIENVYDIQSLLSDKKVIKLQSGFSGLAQILDRKGSIHESFKAFTADLSYDLSVYKRTFDDLDSQYRNEPKEVKDSIQMAIIDSEGQNFMKFFHDKVADLNHKVIDFSQEEHQLHGYYFRRQLWNYILCCALMARTNLKPRGYAGDSEMMKMIYMNDYRGETTFCKLMQKYTVGVPAAQSVRNRRSLIMEKLHKFSEPNHNASQEKIKVLSVACGPAFEIADILVSSRDFTKYHFTLLDQDPLALKEAKQFISDIEKNSGSRVQADFVNLSVRLMLGKKPFKRDLDNFHFIYSMGLFDYLSTPVAKAIIERLYNLLAPGGELIVGNFHVSNPSKHFMEYWGDWHLIHRTEEELKNLLPESSASKVSVIFEDTGSQMFLAIKKHFHCN